MNIPYIICIPTLGRHTIINNLTLKMLQDNNISKNLIKIFIIEEEEALYKSVIPEDYEIIIGKKGLVQQREFIETYYPVGTNIVFLDDDVKSVDLSLFTEVSNLDEFFKLAFNEAITNNCYIWSIYPVFNKYFREKRDRLTNCLNYIIGAFYGIINRPNDTELKLSITIDGEKEDVERTILYFKKDAIVHRYDRIGFETKYYGSVGGLGTLKERLPKTIEKTNELLIAYPEYGKKKVRKSGINEFVLNKLKAFHKIDKTITVLDNINPAEFNKLYDMLNKIKIPFKNGQSTRRGFGKHRAAVFGITRGRFSGIIDISYLTKKYPNIYDELKRIGDMICPFEYTSIHLNHNVVCPKHKDETNVGKSLLVSFGEYTGCNIVIEDVVYNANYRPIVFNGALLEHCNTDNLVGNKYSLVYYNSPYKK